MFWSDVVCSRYTLIVISVQGPFTQRVCCVIVTLLYCLARCGGVGWHRVESVGHVWPTVVLQYVSAPTSNCRDFIHWAVFGCHVFERLRVISKYSYLYFLCKDPLARRVYVAVDLCVVWRVAVVLGTLHGLDDGWTTVVLVRMCTLAVPVDSGFHGPISKRDSLSWIVLF